MAIVVPTLVFGDADISIAGELLPTATFPHKLQV
jgi:hypothetical protein